MSAAQDRVPVFNGAVVSEGIAFGYFVNLP